MYCVETAAVSACGGGGCIVVMRWMVVATVRVKHGLTVEQLCWTVRRPQRHTEPQSVSEETDAIREAFDRGVMHAPVATIHDEATAADAVCTEDRCTCMSVTVINLISRRRSVCCVRRRRWKKHRNITVNGNIMRRTHARTLKEH